jgi:predicted PurR-regulated permease PerM
MTTNLSILSSDMTILSVMGSFFLIIIGIVGYFINKWINAAEKRDSDNQDILTSLNNTLTKVNTNLQVFEATMATTLESIRNKSNENALCITHHEKKLNDHEVRLTVIEKTK